MVDICVIGAGAAGLAAGIFAAEHHSPVSVELLDGATSIGAKILVSGGGRCNVTHDVVTPEDFFGTRHLVRNVLAAFPVQDTVAWFASLGVELKREETGKLFPVTDKARTVLDALTARSRELGVVLRPGHRVGSLEHGNESEQAGAEALPRFVIRHQHGMTLARRVILATGGQSLPRTGSDGAGYGLARHFGHHVTPTVPALVALMLDECCFHAALSGLSQEVEIQTLVEGRPVDRRIGSLLWTHFGISGPVVMDASRLWCLARARGETAEIYGNFLPGRNADQAREWFLAQAAQHPRRSLLKVLSELVPERYAEAVCRHAESDPQQACAQVPRASRSAHDGSHPVSVSRRARSGWNFAEVTAGGIPLEDQFPHDGIEAGAWPGLVGEVLDCDGSVEFNFQWAWATGRVAGRAAAASLNAGCER